jgi:response regulator RpfG family c-di-GMP phosphodiesterase
MEFLLYPIYSELIQSQILIQIAFSISKMMKFTRIVPYICYLILGYLSLLVNKINMEKKVKVLYVDDEENNLISFKATFRTRFYTHIAISGSEALKILATQQIHVIITDQRMPEMTGVQFLEKVIEHYPDAIRVLLTGYADIEAVIDAVNKGKIFHYLTKPWNENELEITINRAYDKFIENLELHEMNEKLNTSNNQLEFLLRQRLLS